MAKIQITEYLHGDKGSQWESGREAGLSEKACDNYAYALYEVEFVLEVDTETGESKIIKVDGKDLK